MPCSAKSPWTDDFTWCVAASVPPPDWAAHAGSSLWGPQCAQLLLVEKGPSQGHPIRGEEDLGPSFVQEGHGAQRSLLLGVRAILWHVVCAVSTPASGPRILYHLFEISIICLHRKSNALPLQLQERNSLSDVRCSQCLCCVVGNVSAV